jgi:hypothetical protein
MLQLLAALRSDLDVMAMRVADLTIIRTHEAAAFRKTIPQRVGARGAPGHRARSLRACRCAAT